MLFNLEYIRMLVKQSEDDRASLVGAVTSKSVDK